MGKNGLSLRSSPNRPAQLCQTSFARTLALGLLSPSLLPNVIPAVILEPWSIAIGDRITGISLRHPLPPCLGRTALRGFAP